MTDVLRAELVRMMLTEQPLAVLHAYYIVGLLDDGCVVKHRDVLQGVWHLHFPPSGYSRRAKLQGYLGEGFPRCFKAISVKDGEQCYRCAG